MAKNKKERGVAEGKATRRLEEVAEVAVGENSQGEYGKIGLGNSESLHWEHKLRRPMSLQKRIA
jgi:hypothetical protein